MSRGFHLVGWNSFPLVRLVSPPTRIPWSTPGTERPAISRVGSEMLTIKNSRSLPSIVRISDARFDGSLNRTSSCAPAMAALTTRMVREPLAHRSADYSSTAIRPRVENFSSRRVKCQLPVNRLRVRQEGRPHAPDPKSRRVVRCAAAAWNAHTRNCRALGSARDGELVLCFWERGAHLFHAPLGDRHLACSDLRAFCGRSVEQPADAQSRSLSGLVHTSLAWMGLELHGRDCPDPHGAGFSLRSL